MEVDALIAKEMVKLKSKCNLWLTFMLCEDCNGKKFKEEVLDIKCFDKNI